MSESTRVIDQLADELRLQAWLANAELRHPSLAQGQQTRTEVDALLSMRDELRVQAHLGKLELDERYHQLEQQWDQLKGVVDRSAAGAEDRLHDLLRELRDGYRRLTG
ncbi:MAG: hypothetical protein ABMA64_32135 [Myxococcota bacterium]